MRDASRNGKQERYAAGTTDPFTKRCPSLGGRRANQCWPVWPFSSGVRVGGTTSAFCARHGAPQSFNGGVPLAATGDCVMRHDWAPQSRGQFGSRAALADGLNLNFLSDPGRQRRGSRVALTFTSLSVFTWTALVHRAWPGLSIQIT